MKIAVKVKLFQLYGYVLSKVKKSVKWGFKWHSNSKPSTLIHGHKLKKKRKPTIGARFKTFQMVYYITYNNLIEYMCKSKNYWNSPYLTRHSLDWPSYSLGIREGRMKGRSVKWVTRQIWWILLVFALAHVLN